MFLQLNSYSKAIQIILLALDLPHSKCILVNKILLMKTMAQVTKPFLCSETKVKAFLWLQKEG